MCLPANPQALSVWIDVCTCCLALSQRFVGIAPVSVVLHAAMDATDKVVPTGAAENSGDYVVLWT